MASRLGRPRRGRDTTEATTCERRRDHGGVGRGGRGAGVDDPGMRRGERSSVSADTSQKVTASHLGRNAYLYVRQSTLRQVFENTESTKRQYALRQRAIALGWASERILVIDCDLGQSAASAA